MFKIIAAALFAIAAVVAGFITIAMVVVGTLGVWLASRLLGGRFPVIAWGRKRHAAPSAAPSQSGDVIEIDAREVSSPHLLPPADDSRGSAPKDAENR
jgi:hypothetical protein